MFGLFCHRFLLPLAFVFVEEDFAHAHKVRGHFNVFVSLGMFLCLFEPEKSLVSSLVDKKQTNYCCFLSSGVYFCGI